MECLASTEFLGHFKDKSPNLTQVVWAIIAHEWFAVVVEYDVRDKGDRCNGIFGAFYTGLVLIHVDNTDVHSTNGAGELLE